MKNNSAGEHEIISSSSSSFSSDSEVEDREVVVTEKPPPTWGMARSCSIGGGRKRLLRKQLSMRETTREAKWEKRRWQILHRRKMKEGEGDEESSPVSCGGGRLSARVRSLTDEDWDELMGSIELGFGFNEEDGGHHLRDTLPALDLYFAVNRQLSDPKLRFSPSPASTPTATSSESTLCVSPDPSSPLEHHHHSHSSSSDSWKICNPGDNPQHVKTRLRHWAQAVACSVRQCY